jgi:hypothetical protein
MKSEDTIRKELSFLLRECRRLKDKQVIRTLHYHQILSLIWVLDEAKDWMQAMREADTLFNEAIGDTEL